MILSLCFFFFLSQHRTEPGYEGHDINILPVWKRGITGKGVVVSILDDGKSSQWAKSPKEQFEGVCFC